MKRAIILLMTFLIVCLLFVYVNGKKSKNKLSEQQKILKEITNGIEKCVKNDKNINKKEKPLFNKCLTGFKKQTNTLDPKDKSTKTILRKVVKNLKKCLKPKKSKKSKDKKNKTSNKKRPKRSPPGPPKRKGDEEKPEGVLAKLEKIDPSDASSTTTNPECPNELSSSR